MSPRPSCTKATVCGMGCSGVAVATTSRSIVVGRESRLLDRVAARGDGEGGRGLVVAGDPRSLIPVRSTIHSSLVSSALRGRRW